MQGAGHGGSAFQADSNVDAITAFINSQLTAVSAYDDVMPTIQQATCFPNPFSATTNISVKTTQSEEIRICVYNVRGQQVGCLYEGYMPAGKHDLRWNGTDGHGNRLVNGLYFVTVASIKERQILRLVIVN